VKHPLVDRPKAAAALIRQWVALPPAIFEKQIEVLDGDGQRFVPSRFRSHFFDGGDVPLMAVKAEVWNACDYFGEQFRRGMTHYILKLEVGLTHDDFERYEVRWKRKIIDEDDEPMYGPWRFHSWTTECSRRSGRTLAGVKKLIAESVGQELTA
jgi:hypothetical protein